VKDILDLLRHNIFAVTEDDNMAIENESVMCRELNINLQMMPRIVPPGKTTSSTDDIISKIKKIKLVKEN
jgi:hypothetical protein